MENPKFITLNSGSIAQVLVPVVTASNVIKEHEDFAYFELANGLFAQAVVPIDETGAVATPTVTVNESDTFGNNLAFIHMTDGSTARAVVLIDKTGGKL